MTWRALAIVGGVAVLAWLAIGAGLLGFYAWRAHRTYREWTRR